MKTYWLVRTPILAVLALLGVLPPALNSVAGAEGLTVGKEGSFELRGRPFRGIGVNYYDAFVRTLATPARTNFHAGFAILAEHGIPFARLSAGGYWPKEWDLYRTNRAAYFARLESVVTAAQHHGIGLVLSLFWYAPTVPDLVGEPVSAWGNPESQTIAFMREYTREVVTRFTRSPSVWAWEFGNEYNLPADLPNAAEHRPAVVPELGTPATRSARDDVTHEQMRSALREFAREVRRHDPHRVIFSGNAFPRPTAWHQQQQRDWTPDIPEQWSAMLTGDNPEPIDTLTGRLYSPDDEKALPRAMALARKLNKPLFVGEFGVPGALAPATASSFVVMLDELSRQEVQLAALWVFDFEGQAADWNVTPTNDRRAQLTAVSALNRRWQKATP